MKVPVVKFVFDRKNVADDVRNPKKKKQGLLQIEVYYDRQRKWMSTGVKLYKGQWSDTKGVINHPNCDDVNRRLRILDQKINNMLTKIVETGEEFDFAALEAEIERTEKSELVEDVIDEVIDRYKILNKSYEPYVTLKNKFKVWGKIVYVKDLTLEKIEAFDLYMMGTEHLHSRSAAVYHYKLKAVCSRLVRMNRLKANPYDNFKFDTSNCDEVRYLTEEEIKKFKEWQPKTRVEHFIKDFSLFQLMTGMANSDVRNLKKEDIEHVGDRYIVRRNTRVKTDVRFSIVLLPEAMEILERNEYNMNKSNLQYMDKKLNKVGEDLVGRKLSSHVFRHSFATVALHNKIPIEYVSKMLGHTNIRTTQRYAKVLAEDVLDQFDKLNGVFK